MPSSKFHDKPFDEGTLTKLNLFELYTREWLPVFLAQATPLRKVIHLFDFFAGPGTDSTGVPGSPIRILKTLAEYRNTPGWNNVQVHLHLFDKSSRKIKELRQNISGLLLQLPEMTLNCEPWRFTKAFEASRAFFKIRTQPSLFSSTSSELTRSLIPFFVNSSLRQHATFCSS